MTSVKNPAHLQIPAMRHLYESELFRFDTIKDKIESEIAQELEFALADVETGIAKIFHPLFVDSWRTPRFQHFSETPPKLIGLDIETEASTGEPMLLGIWTKGYSHILHPTIREFFRCIKNLTDNARYDAVCVWGRLDIQAIIRMFEPTETERQYISMGFAGKWQNKKWKVMPPVLRTIGQYSVFINQYIPGRSLQIGYIKNNKQFKVWIYNITQFYQTTIKSASLGLGLEWVDFAKDTHIIDWKRFETDSKYRKQCLDSNRQDAQMVRTLADTLIERFHKVFECYPNLLVSTGSLTDAAVSKMLFEDKAAYSSINYKWLERNVFNKHTPGELAHLESLLSECFSAGYVDQYGMGFTEKIYMADIAAAYPYQIRNLPDLRHARLIFSNDGETINQVMQRCSDENLIVETAIISGMVTIPENLKFHPITIKTTKRENIRPIGTFRTVYTLDERQFCEKFGATFKDEQFVIVALTERVPHPLAQVSERLGVMRSEIIAELEIATDDNKKKLLDGMQYLVKVIDNSIYGKTVMTLETLNEIDGKPIITGYSTGDKFNLILGCLITARTRIRLSEACMNIAANGGIPILCMTDSVYWVGNLSDLPSTLIRQQKTAGYFETPKEYRNAYIVKTGQYEYEAYNKKKQTYEWIYKLRGIPIDREMLGKESLYRQAIQVELTTFTGSARDFSIMLPIKKLVTIGSHDLESLALIEELEMQIQPFRLSSKSQMRYVETFRETVDTLVMLPQSHINSTNTRQLERLTLIYTSKKTEWHDSHNDRSRKVKKVIYVLMKCAETGKLPPTGRITNYGWEMLRGWYDDV